MRIRIDNEDSNVSEHIYDTLYQDPLSEGRDLKDILHVQAVAFGELVNTLCNKGILSSAELITIATAQCEDERIHFDEQKMYSHFVPDLDDVATMGSKYFLNRTVVNNGSICKVWSDDCGEENADISVFLKIDESTPAYPYVTDNGARYQHCKVLVRK